MINNNIAQFVMNILSNGQNPQQLINQMIQQNPQAQVLLNQMQQSGMNFRDFTLQYAKQNNINLQPTLEMLQQKGIKL